MNKNFIIFACGYDDNNGGVVVLHQLCDLLNRQGEKAFLWNCHKPVFNLKQPFKSIYLFGRYLRKMLKYGYGTNKKLQTPIAKLDDLKNSIVIYPEVVQGNPLMAENVVRWLLHKPGFNSAGKIEYGQGDLFFYYLKAYDDEKFNKFGDNLLHIESIRQETYKQTNFEERKGSCYIMRKARNPRMVHDLSDSVLIDGLSHEEIAIIFNNVKYCISYDTHTMYSIYAVMCGCISVIVPEDGISKEQWQPEEKDRYGLAYGFDDIEYAINTRNKLLNLLEAKEISSSDSVRSFISKCEGYFYEKD